MTRRQREHALRKNIVRRSEKRKRRTGGSPRQPGVRRLRMEMQKRTRRAVSLTSAGFRIRTCSMVRMVKKVASRMRKMRWKEQWRRWW